MAAQAARIVRALTITAVAAAALAGCTSSRHQAGPASTSPGPTSPSPTTPTTRSTTSTPAGAEAPTARGTGKCKIASTSDVAAAYRGKVASEAAGSSGIGNPQCQFALSTSNVGVPGTVTITVNASQSRAAFARAGQRVRGGAVAGVGDAAFYVTNTTTIEFLKGRTVATIQADLRVPGRPVPRPDRVRADTVALARAVVADL
jgi:hypothetical protein